MFNSTLVYLFFILPTLLNLVGCKTTEQIRRERMIDDLSSKVLKSEKQLDESQQNTGSLNLQIQSLEEKLSLVQGMSEENKYFSEKSQTENSSQLQILDHRIQILEKKVEVINQLSKEVQEQKAFIEKVLKTLESLDKNFKKSSTSENKDNKKKNQSSGNHKSIFQEGLTAFQNNNYQEAKNLLQQLLEAKDLKNSEKEKVFHHMGVIEYQNKNKENALIYFSKVLTNFPQSDFAPNSLLHIGKILNELGNKEEAKSALQQVIDKYPHSKRTPEAKKLLEKLK